MTVDEAIEFIKTQRASNKDAYCILIIDRQGKILEAVAYAHWPTLPQVMELAKKHPGGLRTSVDPFDEVTRASLMQKIAFVITSKNQDAQEHGEPTDPTVIAAVVTSTKTGEHWVTLADYYHDYAGVGRQGDTAPPPEAAEGFPPPTAIATTLLSGCG